MSSNVASCPHASTLVPKVFLDFPPHERATVRERREAPWKKKEVSRHFTTRVCLFAKRRNIEKNLWDQCIAKEARISSVCDSTFTLHDVRVEKCVRYDYTPYVEKLKRRIISAKLKNIPFTMFELYPINNLFLIHRILFFRQWRVGQNTCKNNVPSLQGVHGVRILLQSIEWYLVLSEKPSTTGTPDAWCQ